MSNFMITTLLATFLATLAFANVGCCSNEEHINLKDSSYKNDFDRIYDRFVEEWKVNPVKDAGFILYSPLVYKEKGCVRYAAYDGDVDIQSVMSLQEIIGSRMIKKIYALKSASSSCDDIDMRAYFEYKGGELVNLSVFDIVSDFYKSVNQHNKLNIIYADEVGRECFSENVQFTVGSFERWFDEDGNVNNLIVVDGCVHNAMEVETRIRSELKCDDGVCSYEHYVFTLDKNTKNYIKNLE